MNRSIKACLALLVASLAPQSAGSAQADELVILTSFPPAFYEVIGQRFADAHPDIDVEIVQRSTTSGVRFLLEREAVEVDVFWASSPDAFELLKRENQLATVAVAIPPGEENVAGYPVNDIDGQYFGFAFSTFGAAYNPDYLSRYSLDIPTSWSDLTRPAYWSHIGITSPSRSGTTHFIVEALLQTYGWDEGWRMIARIGGNLSTITARSFGITDGIEQGRFGIGPSIDFLVTVERSSDAIAFAALEPLFLVPASVAVLERSANREAAVAFVEFLLSTDTQLLLMTPELGRIPVLKELRTLALSSRGIRLPEPVLVNGSTFDASLSARRYGLVNAIFDQWIVAHRQELSERWRALNALPWSERKYLAARLTTPPVDTLRAAEITAAEDSASTMTVTSLAESEVIAEEIGIAIDRTLLQFDSELESAAGLDRNH